MSTKTSHRRASVRAEYALTDFTTLEFTAWRVIDGNGIANVVHTLSADHAPEGWAEVHRIDA